MTIFSLYIYDRHCECIYYQDWHRTRPLKTPSATNLKPGVLRLPPSSTAQSTVRESIFSNSTNRNSNASEAKVNGGGRAGLPFDEESKLVYGVVLSLRNMVKKLSGKDEAFTSFRTSQYKLHLYETMTGYKFILLSDPETDSLRFVLRQIHVGPFIEHVVRNPLIEVDSRIEGIDNDLFREAVDRHIRGLSMFGT
ncbi:trafficking protein particle complex subunit 1, partial [Tremellales sp. Uapishka_1]